MHDSRSNVLRSYLCRYFNRHSAIVSGRVHTTGRALSRMGSVCPLLVGRLRRSTVGGRVNETCEASVSTVRLLSRSSASCSGEQFTGIPSACSRYVTVASRAVASGSCHSHPPYSGNVRERTGPCRPERSLRQTLAHKGRAPPPTRCRSVRGRNGWLRAKICCPASPTPK